MGAWGYKIEDNDSAMDYLCELESLIEDGLTKKEAIDKLWSRNDGSDDWEILMLAKMEHDEYGYLIHKTEIYSAIEHEIQNDTIKEWSDPELRKKELRAFIKEIGLLPIE